MKVKLIEKKCPNCGASLEFDETAKSCKCEYCHRAFEIERDNSLDVNDLAEQFNLNELKGPLKVFSTFFLGSYIITFVIALVIFCFIFGMIFFGFKDHSNSMKESGSSIVNKKEIIKDVNDLTNEDYDHIMNDATVKVVHTGEGKSDTNHSYSLNSKLQRESVYVAYKDNSNKIIAILSGTYHDFFHQENTYTVYIPLVYENVKENNIAFSSANIDAPKYYFTPEQDSWVYGYGSLDEAYNAAVKPLENNYKVTKK